MRKIRIFDMSETCIPVYGHKIINIRPRGHRYHSILVAWLFRDSWANVVGGNLWKWPVTSSHEITPSAHMTAGS
jgi:hypothetical protein